MFWLQDTRDQCLGQHGHPGPLFQDVLRDKLREGGGLQQQHLGTVPERVCHISCHVRWRIEVIFTRNSQSSPLRYFEGLHIKKAWFVLYGLTHNWSLKSWPNFKSKDSFEPFLSWGFKKYPWWLDLTKNSLRCWGSKIMHPKQNRTFWSECPLTIKGERPAD